MSRHEVDMLAVQQDAITVQSLATRSLEELDLGDPVVAALAAWVTEIDEGIDETLRFSISSAAEDNAAQETAKGRRAALLAGSTVFALVVSGGAAAAVTGDPLLVVKAPFKVIAEANPFDDDESNARNRLPDQAPAVADANKLLAGAQRAMARGDVEEAERLLAEAEALLGDSVNPGQQNRIDKIADEIVGTPDRGTKGDDGGGAQDKSPQDKSPQGEKAVDKDPVDKDPQAGKPTVKPEKPADDTSTKHSGGSADDQGANDPSSAKPEKPSKATGNG